MISRLICYCTFIYVVASHIQCLDRLLWMWEPLTILRSMVDFLLWKSSEEYCFVDINSDKIFDC